MKTTLIVVGIAVVAAVGIGWALSADPKVDMQEAGVTAEQVAVNETAPTGESDTGAQTAGAAAQSGSYVTYAPEKLAMANSGDVVLFFRASWCPSCRTLDADIKKNASSIPASLTILDVDYDAAASLKQRYGVTSQHTLVQVDASGNQIAKWMGSPSLASLVGQVQ